MRNSLTNLPNLRLVFLEVIQLEPEQCDRAQAWSHAIAQEAQAWQTYLNGLALVGFEQWLRDRLPNCTVNPDFDLTESACYLNICDFNQNHFKLCLIDTEHLLDEQVTVPQTIIEQAGMEPDIEQTDTPHFYVLLEVLEEQAQVIIRGLLRHDQLVNYCHSTQLSPSSQSDYQLPLDLFDPEINHLLFYCQFSPPVQVKSNSVGAVVSLAATSCLETTGLETTGLETTEFLPGAFQSTRTRLSQWLQDIFEESWLSLDRLIHPDTQLALNLRSSNLGVKRGRLIDLEMQVSTETLVLLVTITPAPPNQVTALIQLHPSGGNRFLPPDLKLKLRSKAGKLLQEVNARSQDNYIQLKPFKGDLGKRFRVEIGLGDQQITEDFEF
jgi:hypothetical protein